MKGILVALFAALISLAAPAAAQQELKVALVLPGPITDGTFSAAAHQGIKEAEKKYKLKVSIQENVTFAQSEAALLRYAREGYDIIIGHGFQFGDPAKKIHKRFPKTWFIVNTAKVAEAPNLASFDNRWGDAGYIAGAVAAAVTKTGTIGHIGGIPVPVIVEYNEASSAAPSASARTSRCSRPMSARSPTSPRQGDHALDDRAGGADVVTATGNESVAGTIQAAKEKGVMAIGTARSIRRRSPPTRS